MSPNGPKPPPNPSKPASGCALDAGMAEHVVGSAPLTVGEDAIRLVQLLEALLRAVIAVDVGVVLLRELAKGTLDLGVVRIARNAKDVVVVTLDRHCAADHTNWHSVTPSANHPGAVDSAA